MERCDKCGQTDWGQTGEYPCPDCELPRGWDAGQEPPNDGEIVFMNIAAGRVPERMTAEQFAFSQTASPTSKC